MAVVAPNIDRLPAYDYWLFDLDGTLVDVEWEYIRETHDTIGARLRREFTDREAELLWHGLRETRDALLREWDVDPELYWETLHAVEEGERRAEATYLHDDARFIAELDAPVGLVTHCRPFLAEPVFDRLDIGDWFDVVVYCSDALGWKPNPAPIGQAEAELDAVGHGVYAGDMPTDVGAAWNAGLDAIHVERHDPAVRGHCVLADHRVESFAELHHTP